MRYLLRFAVLFAAGSTPVGAETDEARAARAVEPPLLDGVLDDACWAAAEPVTGFVQSSPSLGGAPSFATQVRLAVDADALYIAFRSRSGDPGGLVTSVMQRDGAILDGDDFFVFALDTFHDHRDAYYFVVNPAGVQADGLLVDEGVTIDDTWDGTWRVATRRLEDGWSAEFALPLRDLRFRETDDGTWGFVAIASSRARQEFVMWPSHLGTQGIRVSRYGHLTGLADLDGRQPVVLLPYLTNGSRLAHTQVGDDGEPMRPVAATWERAFGFDLSLGPTPASRLSVALNPDFATVEADPFAFNLTADELFLPERRPFFVEGADLFQTPARLLYTRRIGVDEKVVAGGKLLGRVGATTAYGVMSATTGDGLDAGHQFTALRLKRGILGSSSLGLLAVSKDRIAGGLAGVNRAAGIDVNWQAGPTTRVVVTHSWSERSGADLGWESTADASYDGSPFGGRHRLFARATAEDVSPGFDIDGVGFVPESRIDRRGALVCLRYAYQASGMLREIAAKPEGWLYQDHAGRRVTQDGARVELTAGTAGRLQPGLLLERSRYRDPDDGRRYHNTQRTASLRFGPYPRVGGELSWREGRNFGADVRYLQAEVTGKAAPGLSVTGRVYHLYTDPGDGPASTAVIGVGGIDWRVAPDLSVRIVLQGDTGDGRALANALLRYDFAPGSTLYLSFRESRLDIDQQLVTDERMLLGKVSYRIGG